VTYSHTIEKANEFASDAIERMHAEKLAPTPENYELWYVYYAKTNPEIARAIEVLIEEGQKITDQSCQELHERFLSENRETEKVRQAGDQIQTTIKEISGAVKNAKEATSAYNTSLEDMTSQLSDDVDPAKLQGVLLDVLSVTQGMMQQNQQMESALEKSSSAMGDLQKNLEMVRKEALTDGLTNLANRKSFDGDIKRIAQICKEEGTTFCLLMMDIDHFKTFNDTYGHQVGDQVLKLVSKALVDGVKGKDIAARYGGEEFAIILPDTNIQGGEKVGDSLRKVVARKDVINKSTGDSLGRITLSGGVAEYMLDESTDDLIGRADTALYASKKDGRNRISVASPPPARKATG